MATQQIDSLLEREEAISAIDEVIASAQRGEGSLAVIEAAAGLGKTALLSATRDRAASAKLHVVSALGAELERDFSFGVVRQLFERLVTRARPGERERLLSGPAHLAAPVLGVTLDDPMLAEPSEDLLMQRGAAAMHGLYWLVANIAERGPLLMMVDDAHLADTVSLRCMHYLVRRLEGLPVAALVAARPREPGTNWEALEAIAVERRVRTVPLKSLTPDGAAELVRRAVGSGADDEFCTACRSVTGGNPFLLRELTAELARNGVEPTAASAHRVRELIPDTVARSVLLRVARLPETARALVRAAAVLGSGAQLRDAASLADLDASSAARAADALARAGILAPGLPLRFVHPLVHAAALNDLPDAERTVWHARAARIVSTGGAGVDSVAAHLLRAPPAGDAWVVVQLRRAAAEAIVRGDPRSATSLLRRAFVEPVPQAERIPVLQELLQAGFIAMDPHALEGLDADAEAEIAADPIALKQSAITVVISLYFRGREQEALAVLERGVSAAAAAGDDGLALLLLVRWINFAQVQPLDALRRLEPYAGRVKPGTFAARLLDASRAWFGLFTGRSASETGEVGRRAFADGRLVAELSDDHWVLSTCVFAVLLADDLELGERLIGQILELGRARGFASAVASGCFLSAYVTRLRGDLSRAQEDAQLAVRAFGAAGIVASLPVMTALLVDTLVERGRLADAARELAAAGADAEIPDLWFFAPVLWCRAKLRLAQGQRREAVEDALEAERRANRASLNNVFPPWVSYAAPCLFQVGAYADARRFAEQDLDKARAWGTPRVIGQAQHALGLCTTGPRGVELLRDSVRTLERSPAYLEHARALVDLGAALRRHNRRSEAREPLRMGLDMAHRCDAQPLAERALHELRATGAKPRKAVLTGVEALTPSERRVAALAAEGQTNRQIAHALFVTIKTVDTHMTHVFQKLDLHSRSELEPVLRGRAL